MSNIKKSFNFRYGVQVDEDNFIVNSNGLVGIGTSVPTEFLDVRGTAKIVGLVTANSLFTPNGTVGVLSVTNLTAGGLSAKAGIITATLPYPLGIVTYFGDGGNLLNLPTSQWIDVDTGFGYTSIYAAGNVGVGTTYPDYTFQVGGTPEYKRGVGINSTGDIFLTGIITAGSHGIFGGIGSFAGNLITNRILTVGSGATIAGGLVVGGGATITGNLNFGGSASFNTSGSFGGSLTVGGAVTASSYGFFGSDLVVGGGATIANDLNVNQSIRATLDVNTGRHLTAGAGATVGGGFIVGGGATIANSLSVGGNGSITRDLVVGYGGTFGRNLVVGASATVGGGAVVGGGLTVSGDQVIGKKLTVNSSGTFGSNLYVSGISTLNGIVNAQSAVIGNVEINVNPNTIFVSSGNLLINTSGGIVTVQDSVNVTNQLSVVQLFTADGGSNLSDVRVGIDTRNKIDTSIDQLILSSNNHIVKVEDDLNVIGTISAGSGVTFTGSIFTNKNLYVSGISTFDGGVVINNTGLTANTIKIGVDATNRINSTSSELQLNSSGDKVRLLSDLLVDRNSYLSGITSVTSLVPTTDGSGNVGSASRRFGEAFIDDVRIGVSGTSVIDTISGTLQLSSSSGTIQLSNNTNITGNILQIGSPASLYLNGTNKSIGIGTTDSNLSLNILTTANKTVRISKSGLSNLFEFGFTPSTGVPVLSIGSSSVGSGKNNVNITYDDNKFTLSNENYGDISFVLDNSNVNIGAANTGSFIVKHGRLSNNLFIVDYRGNVSISSDVSVANNIKTSNENIILQSSGNAFISSNFSAGNGVLQVNRFGNICTATNLNIDNNVEVTSAFRVNSTSKEIVSEKLELGTRVFVGISTEYVNVLYTATGNIGIGTTTITGITTTGLTVGLQLEPIPGVTTLGYSIVGIGVNLVYLNTTTTNLSPINSQTFRFGNRVIISPRSLVDFSRAGVTTNDHWGSYIGDTLQKQRFMLPPVLTTSERTGLTAVAGAMIYNSDTNKHQGWNGTAWFDFY